MKRIRSFRAAVPSCGSDAGLLGSLRRGASGLSGSGVVGAAVVFLSLSGAANAQAPSLSIAATPDPVTEAAGKDFTVTLTLPAGESLASALTVNYQVGQGGGAMRWNPEISAARRSPVRNATIR